MLPDMGAPVRPSMGGGNGPEPGSGPPPPGAPGGPGGGAPDQVNSGIQAVMGQIRELGALAQRIGTTIPPLQAEMQQIQAIIRQAIIKAGQAAPTQSSSSSALPMGG